MTNSADERERARVRANRLFAAPAPAQKSPAAVNQERAREQASAKIARLRALRQAKEAADKGG